MASTLKNVVSYVAVASGAQVTAAHGLNREGTGLVPDSVRFSNELFSLVAADATDLTVQNNGPAALDLDALVESWHTVDRNFVTPGQAALSPQPFLDNSASVSVGGVQPSVFVYQPGGVTIGNIYATWAELMAELPTISGPKEIFFDTSITSPAPIPAGGPYDMTDVTWKGEVDAGVVPNVLVADGASFTNLLVFESIYVLSDATTSPMELSNGDRVNISKLGDVSCNAGAAPFFTGVNLGAAEYAVIDLHDWGNLGVQVPNEVVFTMPAAAATLLFWQIGDRSWSGNNTVATHALCTTEVIINSTSGLLYEQGGIAGALTVIRRQGSWFNDIPGRGVAAAVANTGNQVGSSRIRLDATAGTFTQNMPEVAHVGTSTILTDGRTTVISEVSGINGVTLDGYGAETIDGQATYFLPPGRTMMFVSDGVSNWTSMAISNAFAGPSGDFIFRPGGVEDIASRVFVDWPTLMLALASVDGPKVLAFDDSITSPAVVPAGGPYDMAEVEWRGTSVSQVHTAVTVADGASFTNLRSFRYNLNVLNSNLTASPVADLAHNDRVSMVQNVDISSSVGAEPFFSMAGVASGEEINIVMRDSCHLNFFDDDAATLGDVVSGAIAYITMYNNCGVWKRAMAGAAGADAIFYRVGPQSTIVNSQALWLGNDFQYWNLAQGERWMMPASGTVPGTAAQVLGSQQQAFVRLNANAGVISQPLPQIVTAATNNAHSGGRSWVIAETDGTNGVTVTGTGGDTINGAASYSIPPGGAAMFMSDGVSAWTAYGISIENVLNRHNTFTQAQGVAKVTLTDAASIATDASLGNVFEVTLTANRLLAAPTNMVSGFTYMWIIKQDAGGTNTLTYNNIFKFPGGTAPTLTLAGDAVDIITAVYDGTILACVFQADFK